MKELQHFSGASSLEELLEDQSDPVLHFLVGIVTHDVGLVAYQTNRKCQSQGATLGFVQQTGREARPDGEQFNLRELAFQTQEHAAIRGGPIINGVAGGNEAMPIAAEI